MSELSYFQTVFDMPFNSVRRYHLVVARDLTQPSKEDLARLEEFEGGAIFVVMIKGAPEVVLDSCSYLQLRNERVPIDRELRKECQVNAQT